eukprot:2717514-Pyramimonas_sp.AAC.1
MSCNAVSLCIARSGPEAACEVPLGSGGERCERRRCGPEHRLPAPAGLRGGGRPQVGQGHRGAPRPERPLQNPPGPSAGTSIATLRRARMVLHYETLYPTSHVTERVIHLAQTCPKLEGSTPLGTDTAVVFVIGGKGKVTGTGEPVNRSNI